MTSQESALGRAQVVKQKYEAELLRKKNTVGVGIGFKRRQGQLTNQVAIVVNVRKKVAKADLDPEDLIPETLEGIPVDVLEVGAIEAR